MAPNKPYKHCNPVLRTRCTLFTRKGTRPFSVFERYCGLSRAISPVTTLAQHKDVLKNILSRTSYQEHPIGMLDEVDDVGVAVHLQPWQPTTTLAQEKDAIKFGRVVLSRLPVRLCNIPNTRNEYYSFLCTN